MEWRYLRLRAKGGDCVVHEYPEDAAVLEKWMAKLDFGYRGQRLAAAASEVFAALLKARRDRCDLRELLLEQRGLPARQSRFCRHVHETYACSPRLPPLVCGLAKCDPDRVCQGVDVVRCRKMPSPTQPFPCAEEGRLADLTFVRKKEDRRVGLVGRLPYVGSGWYGKPATANMLDTGLATWADFECRLAGLPRPGTGDHGEGLARGRGAHGQARRQRSHRTLGPVQARLLQHANVQSPGGRPGLPVPFNENQQRHGRRVPPGPTSRRPCACGRGSGSWGPVGGFPRAASSRCGRRASASCWTTGSPSRPPTSCAARASATPSPTLRHKTTPAICQFIHSSFSASKPPGEVDDQ